MRYSELQRMTEPCLDSAVLQRCSVLLCVSVLQSVAECFADFFCAAEVLQRAEECRRVLQGVAE